MHLYNRSLIYNYIFQVSTHYKEKNDVLKFVIRSKFVRKKHICVRDDLCEIVMQRNVKCSDYKYASRLTLVFLFCFYCSSDNDNNTNTNNSDNDPNTNDNTNMY